MNSEGPRRVLVVSGSSVARIAKHFAASPESVPMLQHIFCVSSIFRIKDHYVTLHKLRCPPFPSLVSFFMIPPLSLLALTSTNLPSALINVSSPPTLDCFTQNPPSEVQFPALTYKQCLDALAVIPTGDKPSAPINFFRGDGEGLRVPIDWHPRNGKCGVVIDVVADDVQETASFGAIKDRATALMRKCVINPPHLGGWSVVGEDDKLSVEVFGVIDEEQGHAATS